MQLAAGRLRVLGSFSLSVRVEPNREKLQAKARAHARTSGGHLELRTATLLAEREGVIAALDGRRPWGSRGPAVPRWRWHKRRMLTHELCGRNRIDKWW